MLSLQHLFLMSPGSGLCPGEGDWPGLHYRKGSAGTSLIHKRLNSRQRGNVFIITSPDQDAFPKAFLGAQNSGCTCMYMHVCMHFPTQRSKRTVTLKTIRLLAQLRGRRKSKWSEREKARETEIKRKNQGEHDFLSTKQQGRILVHLIGNVSFVCKQRLEPALISQIKAF